MKKAVVNGQNINAEAVNFELERLIKFYASHGVSVDEVKANLPKLEEKALEQVIGTKLLLDHAAKLNIPVNQLIEKACAHTLDPSEEEVSAYCQAHKGEEALDYKTVKDLLRHNARGRSLAAFVAQLREEANIEYHD